MPQSSGESGACPHCGRPLRSEQGEPLRPVDVRCDGVTARQRRLVRPVLWAGAGTAAVVGLLAPLLHAGFTPALVVPALLAAHMIVIRMVLVREAWGLLGPRRRFFARWLLRLSFLWAGVPGYGLSLVPGLGVVAAPATFLGLSALSHFYVLWSLREEKERRPFRFWEKLALCLLGAATVAVLAAAVILSLLLGWGIHALWGWVHPASR